MKRIGTVLTFKPEVTREEAARALKSIGFLLDTPAESLKGRFDIQARLDAGEAVRYEPGQFIPVPFKHDDLIREYDDDMGGPVWYIP